MFPAEEEKWRGINTRIKYLLLDDIKNINYPEAPSGVTKKEVARQEWYEWKYRNREVEDYYHHPRDDDDI